MPFNNMRTLKFKTQPTNSFSATFNQMFGSPSQLPTTAQRALITEIFVHSSDNQTVLRSSPKLGGPAEHLIGGNEKHICWSTFEFKSPHDIQKCSNLVIFYFYKKTVSVHTITGPALSSAACDFR